MTTDYRSYPILYVDDEVANLVAVEYGLGDEFQILTTPDPQVALKMLAERDIAVMLVDQRMPTMSGADLCAQARAVRPETLRIIITAYADLHTAIDAINRGQVSRYLSKPFENEELAEVLRTALDLVEVRRTVRSLERRVMTPALGVAIRNPADASLARQFADPILNLQTCMRRTLDLLTASLASVGNARRLSTLLETAQTSQTEGLALLDRLSELAHRVSAGEGTRDKTPEAVRTDLARVVESAARQLRTQAEPGVKLEVVVESAPVVSMDASALAQVVMQLVTNATRAVAGHAARKPEAAVRVRITGTNDEAYLQVEDDGPGIDASLLERIFDPFYTTSAGREGLGLAHARAAITNAGGGIEVMSELGRGSTFVVRLPVVPS